MTTAKRNARKPVLSGINAIVAAIHGDAIRASIREFVAAGDMADAAADSAAVALFGVGVTFDMLAKAPHNGTRETRPVVEGAEAEVILAVEDDILAAWAPDAVALVNMDNAARMALSPEDKARRARYVSRLSPRFTKLRDAVGAVEHRAMLAKVDSAEDDTARKAAASAAVQFKAKLDNKRNRAAQAPGGKLTVCGTARESLTAASTAIHAAVKTLLDMEKPPVELNIDEVMRCEKAARASIAELIKFIPAGK